MGYLEPAVLLQLPRLGQPRQWGEGEPIALPSDSVLLLLEGDWERAGRPVAQCPDQGQAEAPPALVGLLDYLGGAGTEAGETVCQNCIDDLKPITAPRCERCSRPFDGAAVAAGPAWPAGSAGSASSRSS